MRRALSIGTAAAMLSTFALIAAWALRIHEVHRINELAVRTCQSDEKTRLALRLVIEARLPDPDTSEIVKAKFRRIESVLLRPRACP